MSISFDRFLLAERLARQAAGASRELIFDDKKNAERVLNGFRHLGETAALEERTDAEGAYWVVRVSGGAA